MRAHEAITVDSSPLLARGASKRATTYSELASDLDGGASARSSWTRATKLFLGTAAVAGIDSRQMFRSARAFFAKFTRTGSGTSDEGPPSQWHLSR